MEESILTSTKKMLGIGDDDTSFDHDILTHINAAFSHLQQLGIGPADGFAIVDESKNWADFITVDNTPVTSMVKTNIWLRVRLLFDPPATSFLLTSFEKQLEQSDWRLNVLRESTEWVNPDPTAIIEDDILDGGLI